MTAHALHHGPAASDVSRRNEQLPESAGASPGSTGLGGNTLARIVEDNCPGMPVAAGVVIEHLDAQVGTWQLSTDEGQTWRVIRTDLINRDGHLGLALDRDARLRVLPFGGQRVDAARVAFHPVPRSHGQGNGSYRAYASDDREEGANTVTLVLCLSAINGKSPAVHVPRLRNKRAQVRSAMPTSAGVAEASFSGALA